MPRKKVDPSAPSRSTSAVLPKPEVDASEAITSGLADSPTPSNASETLTRVPLEEMGDIPALIERLKAEGVSLYLIVNGSTQTAVNAKIGSAKRNQSLPPGDLLILVLPAIDIPRRPGVYMLGVTPA